MRRFFAIPAICIGLSWFALPVMAVDLYSHDGWSALASDRVARKTGDILTIVVYENATATNSANTSSKRGTDLGGQISAGSNFNESGGLNLNRASENEGSTGRSNGMVAQISAIVDEVMPNGDLHVSGSQVMNVNGERTNIRVAGRVRLADISAQNAVLSNRLADAQIDYEGQGFVSRTSQPGIVTRIFDWLGLP